MRGKHHGYGTQIIGAAAAEDFRLWMERLVPLAMDVFVYGGFPLLWLVGKLRKKL